MMTVRQIERHWNARNYGRLLADLLAARPEASLHLGIDMARPPAAAAAALAIIRLDELSQSDRKVHQPLLRAILSAQQADGGWGDFVITALCLRALLCGNGNGIAIERGMKYLADLQKPEGIWPNVPIRRMPADPYVSALILYQLADQPRFRQTIRIGDAVKWFARNQPNLDAESRELWQRASRRCPAPQPQMQPSLC